MIRSYREHLLTRRAMSLAGYRSSGWHKSSALYTDTLATIEAVCNLRARYGASALSARLYSSVPAHFMLLVDDAVLVEPYNYGKLAPPGAKPGVGPSRKGYAVDGIPEGGSDLYERDPLRSPFGLMEDHFRFVFDQEARELECGQDDREST
jgi:hypothetical protein